MIRKLLCKLGIHKVKTSYDTGYAIIRICGSCGKESYNRGKWR